MIIFFRCLVHLSRNKADVAVFAPDKDQLHVVNHLKGAPSENETRLLYILKLKFIQF